MTNSRSILAFVDIQKICERLIESGKRGTRLTFDDPAARDAFQWRFYAFRKAWREHNKVLYPDPGNTMHGRSIFDEIQCKQADGRGGQVLELLKISSFEYNAEDII